MFPDSLVTDPGMIKVKVKVAQSCPTLCIPMDCAVHGILQARILEWVAFPFTGSSQPGDRTQVLPVQAEILPTEPPGKPKNTVMGSLSLLQGIFLTQELNRDLLHCRQILYHFSHQESPRILEWVAYSFSSGSSQPRDQTRVSCTAGRFSTT